MANITRVEIGKNIKERRERRGFSQAWLAKKVGVVQGYISMVENGQRDVDATTLYAISDVLGYNIEAFFGTDSEKPKKLYVGDIKCPQCGYVHKLYVE